MVPSFCIKRVLLGSFEEQKENDIPILILFNGPAIRTSVLKNCCPSIIQLKGRRGTEVLERERRKWTTTLSKSTRAI
jgi:hypothetical protein